MEEERREHVAKMKKMEMEMEQVFEMKVKEKIQKLRDSEAEVLTTPQFSENVQFLSVSSNGLGDKTQQIIFLCIIF